MEKHFPAVNTRRPYRSLCRWAMVLVMMTAMWSPAVAANFSDSLGRRVDVPLPPARIVSLAPNLTEILYALGLGDRIVAVTQFSTHPTEASRKPRVGSYARLNVEKIISMRPDLVIGTKDGNNPRTVKLLDQAGIPVYVVNPRKVMDMVSTIREVGKLCGAEKKAQKLASRIEIRMRRISRKTAGIEKPLVFLQINIKPMMSVNRNTYHHDVIRLAGGRNMTGDEPITYPRISLEEVLQRNPEVIIISSMERGGRYEKARRSWYRWATLRAVKNNRVHLVNSDLLDRPSPRLMSGLEILVRLFHPELDWGGIK